MTEKEIIELAEKHGIRFEKFMTNPPKPTGYMECNTKQLFNFCNALREQAIKECAEIAKYYDNDCYENLADLIHDKILELLPKD